MNGATLPFAGIASVLLHVAAMLAVIFLNFEDIEEPPFAFAVGMVSLDEITAAPNVADIAPPRPDVTPDEPAGREAAPVEEVSDLPEQAQTADPAPAASDQPDAPDVAEVPDRAPDPLSDAANDSPDVPDVADTPADPPPALAAAPSPPEQTAPDVADADPVPPAPDAPVQDVPNAPVPELPDAPTGAESADQGPPAADLLPPQAPERDPTVVAALEAPEAPPEQDVQPVDEPQQAEDQAPVPELAALDTPDVPVPDLMPARTEDPSPPPPPPQQQSPVTDDSAEPAEQPDEIASVLQSLTDPTSRAPDSADGAASGPGSGGQDGAGVAPLGAPVRAEQVLGAPGVDAVRRAIKPCYNPPFGAQGAENMRIPIRATLNSSGVVIDAQIVEQNNMGDPVYRAAADSARRALLNGACQPLPLASNLWPQWQYITFNFSMDDML